MRQACDPAALVHPATVETLDHQHLLVAETADGGRGHVEAEGRHQARTEPLVLHGVRHVCAHVADQPERQLEDVRGRRGAVRTVPLVADAQQRCLFLCARDRDAKVVVGIAALSKHRVARDIAQQLRHAVFRQGFTVDAVEGLWCLAGREQLHGPDAVAPDGREQVGGFDAGRAKTPAQTFADAVAVGEEVVEVVLDRGTP
ncbi:hypothetical protein D9M72_452140 [compost metagenome]